MFKLLMALFQITVCSEIGVNYFHLYKVFTKINGKRIIVVRFYTAEKKHFSILNTLYSQ